MGKIQHSTAPWNVRPDYGKENVYRLWDKNDNYHDDTSPEAMDSNARLISAAPELLDCLKRVRGQRLPVPVLLEQDIEAAISKAEGRN